MMKSQPFGVRCACRFSWLGWPLLVATGMMLGPAGQRLEAVEPSVSYIFPAGGQRGQQVQVRVGGHFLLGEATFTMSGPGITASPTVKETDTIWFEGPIIPQPASQRSEDYPRDHAGTVTIADDTPVGYRRWHVQTSQGITPSMLFMVGDLPEVIEQEIDGAPVPTKVTVPVTINGRIFPREDVDLWTFQAKAGETCWAEVHAARLGYPLQAHLAVYGPDGEMLADDSGTSGGDPFVTFTAPRDGEYQLRIHDSNFGGLQHYVYRLSIDRAPYVRHYYPLGGRRRSELSLELSGPGLEQATAEVELPQEGTDAWVRPSWNDKSLNPVLLELGDDLEVLEAEPNQTAAEAKTLPVPGVANGRIGTAGDVDLWAWQAQAGVTYRLEVAAARLGSPLDGVLTIKDANGKTLATADDDGGAADPALNFNPPAAGTYYVQVAERFTNRSGPQFAYRLKAMPVAPQPSFEFRGLPEVINVEPGTPARLRFTVVRQGGFDGAIQVEAENLPEGVTVKGNVGARQTQGQLTIECAEDVEWPQRLELKLVGRGEHVTGDKPDQVRTEVVAVATPAVPRGMPPVDGMTLFIGAPTPFKFVGEYSLTYAPQGSILTKRYTLQRNGYQGPLTVRLADKQARHLQGVTGPTLTLGPEVEAFTYPVTLPPWLDIGRTSRTVLVAIGEVSDRHGNKHRVSYTSTAQNEQIIAVADPAQLTLTATPTSIMADPQQPAEIHVRIARAATVTGPITLSLRLPDHVRGVQAEPVVLADGAEEGTLRARFAEGAGPFNAPVAVRASAGEGQKLYFAETAIEVVPPPAP